jgi:hypothetical protein
VGGGGGVGDVAIDGTYAWSDDGRIHNVYVGGGVGMGGAIYGGRSYTWVERW